MNSKKWQWMTMFAVCALLLGAAYDLVAAGEDIPDETALIGVIKSDADWLAKQTACRALRQKGTAKSVPALAALLPDEKLSHLARYALEPMPYPEAGQALRDGLGKTSGALKAGVVSSLGVRRDAEAVALVAPLLKDADADIARAAAGALGRIASPEAIQALLELRSAAPEPISPAVAEGLLAAGLRLTQDGKGEQAAPVYEELLSAGWPMYVRMGAFHGLAYAQPAKAPQRLIEALGGKEPQFRDVAAQVIAETSGADTTKLYADALPRLPADGQAALLRGLAGRKDPAARAAVVQVANSGDRAVRLAAVKALGVLGGAQDVPALTGLLVSDDSEIADAATASLTVIEGKDVNAAIAGSVPGAAPALRVKLMDLLLNRRAEQTLTLAAKSLDDGDASVRAAGLRALGPLGNKEQVHAILAILAKTSDSEERGGVEKALGAIGSRHGEDVLPLVLDALKGSSTESHIVLLRVVARIGGPKSLETILAALKDANSDISGEAVRLLADWPTADAMPHLVTLAQSDDLSRQVLALRGYVRLAGNEPSPDARTRMLTKAMELAKRPEEKKVVLGAWGRLRDVQALDALRPYLDDAAVRNEAALAIVSVADHIDAKNETNKVKATEALKTVIEKCGDPEIRKNAEQVLADYK